MYETSWSCCGSAGSHRSSARPRAPPWPVRRQFEQVFNAYYVNKMGYGAYWDDLNKERVDSFLFNLDHYRTSLKAYPRAGNAALLSKLDALVAAHR